MPPRIPDEIRERIRFLYQRRMGSGAIARVFGVSRWTVHNICRDLVHQPPIAATSKEIREIIKLQKKSAGVEPRPRT